MADTEEIKQLEHRIRELEDRVDALVRRWKDLSPEFAKWWDQHLAKYRDRQE